MISRNQFEELKSEIDQRTQVYPNQSYQAVVAFGGGDTYDSYFAVTQDSDTTIDMVAGYAIGGLGVTTIGALSGYTIDDLTDGDKFLIVKLYEDNSGNIKTLVSIETSIAAPEYESPNSLSDRFTYPINVARITMASSVIDNIDQIQRGFHYISAGTIS